MNVPIAPTAQEIAMIPPRLPSLVSHGDALALELRPGDPLEVSSGDPRASVMELYRDDRVECGVWEVTPGEFDGANAGFGEHMHVLCGDATVTSEDGGAAASWRLVRRSAGVAWTLGSARDRAQDLRHLDGAVTKNRLRDRRGHAVDPSSG